MVDSVDVFVGNKIKERRKTLKISQSALAEMLGISYQQVQKYESGVNKVTIRRLMQLSELLKVPATFFYEGAPINDDKIGKAIESDVINIKRQHPLNILIIEDNAGDELLLREAITESGEIVNIESLNDSTKVIDYLMNHEKYGKSLPDLIILDLNMPKIDGTELLKRIKQNSAINTIPIVILTNSISTNQMNEVYKFQAAGFIPKSVDYEEFASNVELVIKYWSNVVVLPHM